MSEEKKLFPYFQPIVGAANGYIVGYEALVRQYGVNGRIISAGELFSSSDIPYQQLIEWDRVVRRQALQQFSQIKNYDCYLTINISATWIDYVSDFNALPTLLMIDEFNIDRNRVVIEITESKGNMDKLVKAVDMYRKNGLKVAIDDFGAGFSQLERVMAIQPDIIKLDMQLFQKASKGGIAGDIVHLLTRLAKRTGCRIVCEGVETEDEFFFGLTCGAQYMQGYLFSPATAEFTDSLHFQESVKLLRNKYLQQTLPKEQDKIKFLVRVKHLVEYLRGELENGFNLNQLPTDCFERSGILRFYICNNEGDQISSNFNLSANQWLSDATKVGFNWAWRPYFYKLLALESIEDSYRVVTSERYRDFSSEVLCKTMSIRVDQERILLVDIAADWR